MDLSGTDRGSRDLYEHSRRKRDPEISIAATAVAARVGSAVLLPAKRVAPEREMFQLQADQQHRNGGRTGDKPTDQAE